MRKSVFSLVAVAAVMAITQSSFAVVNSATPFQWTQDYYYNGFGGAVPNYNGLPPVESSVGFSTIADYDGRVLANAAITNNGVSATNPSPKSPLQAINTNLFSGTDVNLYRIRITDPTTFRAAVTSSTLILALFDAAGNGVAQSIGGTGSALTLANGVVTTPGTYYIGLANPNLFPRNNAGQRIFGLPGTTAGITLPDPTVVDKTLSTNALLAWSPDSGALTQLLTNTSFTAGGSQIQLSGADFAVPEPATLGALAGVAALGLVRRRRA